MAQHESWRSMMVWPVAIVAWALLVVLAVEYSRRGMDV